jgi:apolipoprotein N-acyltransferase
LIAVVGAVGGSWSVIAFAAWIAGLFTNQLGVIESLTNIVVGVFIILLLWALPKIWHSKKPQHLRVAVSGWLSDETGDPLELNQKLAKSVKIASEAGAKLLVTPEAAFTVENRAAFRNSIQSLASKHKIALAIGYFDCETRENCIDFVDATGEIHGRYVKTHLVPVFETYVAGKGDLALMNVDGVKIGGLICQDDNFADIARKYAKAGAQLLAIPTQDWINVKDLHFVSHRWRALEFRFALARAASNGISSLTSSNGDILKKADHFSDGAKVLIEDVPVGTGKPTFYARSGDLFPIVCGLVSLGCLIFAR